MPWNETQISFLGFVCGEIPWDILFLLFFPLVTSIVICDDWAVAVYNNGSFLGTCTDTI